MNCAGKSGQASDVAVARAGLEPASLSTQAPKTCVYANSTTGPGGFLHECYSWSLPGLRLVVPSSGGKPLKPGLLTRTPKRACHQFNLYTLNQTATTDVPIVPVPITALLATTYYSNILSATR